MRGPIVSASHWQGTAILATVDSMEPAYDLECVAGTRSFL